MLRVNDISIEFNDTVRMYIFDSSKLNNRHNNMYLSIYFYFHISASIHQNF